MHEKDYTTLNELLQRGGVYYNIQGESIEEILGDLLDTIALPDSCDRQEVLTAMLEREALMPTALGEGIAVPHPRNPLIPEQKDQLVSVCFPERPIPWQALDGKPVHTIICILSSTPRDHLRTLSRISYLCRQEAFNTLLAHRADRKEIQAALIKAEELWLKQ